MLNLIIRDYNHQTAFKNLTQAAHFFIRNLNKDLSLSILSFKINFISFFIPHFVND